MSTTLDLNKITNVYLVGIGGIGMSALARYFKTIGKFVAGYDKTSTALTDNLIKEGIPVHFEDNLSLVPEQVLSQKDTTLVIFTPAVPNYHYEFNYFIEREYIVMKRAEVLGFIFSSRRGVAVAGTHGKTTTSTIIAHILKQSQVDCNAFLGGISKNYESNLILSEKSDIVVAEADEFDRSFHQLFPYMAVVTSIDADHLDIYGNKEEVIISFNQFVSQIGKNGTLIYKKGIPLSLSNVVSSNIYTYSAIEEADFYPVNVKVINGLYHFDLKTPQGTIKDLLLGIPGLMNLENSIAAIAVSYLLGVTPDEIRASLAGFQGVKRRFEYLVRTHDVVYIDDYAHHPEELKACITSARKIFEGKKITGVFQPHLFSRTRDFAPEFAESLSMLDELILLDIYPARELPIPGITSDIIFNNVTISNKTLCKKGELLDVLKSKKIEVLLTMGAGDIDRFMGPISDMLLKKY